MAIGRPQKCSYDLRCLTPRRNPRINCFALLTTREGRCSRRKLNPVVLPTLSEVGVTPSFYRFPAISARRSQTGHNPVGPDIVCCYSNFFLFEGKRQVFLPILFAGATCMRGTYRWFAGELLCRERAGSIVFFFFMAMSILGMSAQAQQAKAPKQRWAERADPARISQKDP